MLKYYCILGEESMAEINGTINRLHLWKETNEELEDKKEALVLSKNRHHFKNISFHSSLTEKIIILKQMKMEL